jgi:flagellin
VNDGEKQIKEESIMSSMVINHNISAMNTYRNLSSNETSLNQALKELSSGLRINSAADDASGLTISQQMAGQITGLNQATNNAQDDTNMLQTADGALSQTASILQTMRTLAVQAADSTNTSSDRVAMQSEVDQLTAQITQIATNTQFNGMILMSGSYSANAPHAPAFTFQIGADKGQTLTMNIASMTAGALMVASPHLSAVNVNAVGTGSITGLSGTATVTMTYSSTNITSAQVNYDTNGALSIGTSAQAAAAIVAIDYAINQVSTQRATFGAIENRLADTITNLQNIAQNLTAASSQITDVDMAQEMTKYSQMNIINQSATAMLSQANQLPQGVLKLLQNI